MPKIKKKLSKHTYTFNINRILKERKAEAELDKINDELDKRKEIVDGLFEAAIKSNNINESDATKTNSDVFDPSKYNIPFKEDADFTKSCVQRLHILSIEGNELEANIHFNHLTKANWSLKFHDIQNIFSNWGFNLNTLINNPLLTCEINKCNSIQFPNFYLILEFISRSIKENNKLSKKELLTLAKSTVVLSFNNHCGQMNIIKKLFSICIEIAFYKNIKNDIITFSEELYSLHTEDNLLKTLVDLFLPINSKIVKRVYSYLAFKLYKSLLGLTNNINAFPTNINDLFIQNVVDKMFFKKHPDRILDNVIVLMEHVVNVFDLYQDEKQLKDMYDFLYVATRPMGKVKSLRLIGILDQWRLKLFRLYVIRKNNEQK